MKIEYLPTLIAISPYLEAEFDYGSTILHKKFQVISSKNEGVTAIFPIQIKIAVEPLFLLKMTWNFLCRIVEP